MLKGNKGDWSEVYTLLKLLSDKTLYIGDENLEQIKDLFYPILHIIRSESSETIKYFIKNNKVQVETSKSKYLISLKLFRENAKLLLDEIQNNPKGVFRIPSIEEFMNKISMNSVKAKSSSKTDIIINIHDFYTNQTPTLGFSIKSQVGRPSTLLNASKTTNFVFELIGSKLSQPDIDIINSINIPKKGKVLRRVSSIIDKGCKFKFIRTEKNIFNSNLTLIDSCLPKILSEAVLCHYKGKCKNLSEIVKRLEIINPLNYDISTGHKFYEYKIKRFLTDIALGMMPSKVWDGVYDATGGYLIVKEDGDIVCYHFYKKNEFENYLLSNTKLITPSTTRHDFALIYKEKDRYFIKLNLQIRFNK